MNDSSSGIYFDGLDGSACSPGNYAQGYEFICTYLRVNGIILLFCGVFMYYIVYLQRQARLMHRDTAATAVVSTARPSSTVPSRTSSARLSRPSSARPFRAASAHLSRPSITRPPGVVPFGENRPAVRNHSLPNNRGKVMSNKKTNSRSERTLALIATQVTSAGLAWILSTHGASQPSTSVLGLIGDFAVAILFPSIWYHALRQMRTAIWFRSLTQLKSESSKKSIAHMLTLGLDKIQSTFAPVISFLLWVLVAVGLLPRSWFYAIGYLINAFAGFRALIAIATQRISGLRDVATLQNKIAGTSEDMKRRHGVLQRKAIALVIDLSITFTSTVLGNFTLVVFGSVFSSRQFVFHYCFMMTMHVLLCILSCFSMWVSIGKAKSKRRQLQRRVSAVTPPTSGLSLTE